MKPLVNHIKRWERCCPGHDDWPNDTYSSNRSKRAMSRDKKKSSRYARHKLKNQLQMELQ